MYPIRAVSRAKGTLRICFKSGYGTQTCRLLGRNFHVFSVLRCNIHLSSQAFSTDIANSDDASFRKLSFDDESQIVLDKKENVWSTFENHTENLARQHKRHVKDTWKHPRSVVNSIYDMVRAETKRSALSVKYTYERNSWLCTYKASWPTELEFSATAGTKSLAANHAALELLNWLDVNKKLVNDKPRLYSSGELQELLNCKAEVRVDEEHLSSMEILLDEYKEYVRDIVEAPMGATESGDAHGTDSADVYFDTVKEPVPPNIIDPFRDTVSDFKQIWSTSLRYKPQRIDIDNSNLPIFEYKNEILAKLKEARVLLIKGGTGCGKTTQVPQFIFDSYSRNGDPYSCAIIISQPRRLSAISLAERIAKERGESVGDVVGYKVRLDEKLPCGPFGMLFCSSGILLHKLQINPNLIGCSHVILDEVHERSIDTDMSLVLVKRAIKNNPFLKLIIMSATINADLFRDYFKCPVVDVPGRTYPVRMSFLDEIEKRGIVGTHESSPADLLGPVGVHVDCQKIADIVQWIYTNKPPGAILCFLPGWSEIQRTRELLEQRLDGNARIFPAHSRVSTTEQQRIFDAPPKGCRKIILATDIAETGITVSDIVYVVDSAVRKAMAWDDEMKMSYLSNTLASKANIEQRKGRAGRVQPGESYHCITREQHEALPAFPASEMLSTSLEKVVLNSKSYSTEKAAEFFGHMLESPTPEMLAAAVKNLIKIGALAEKEQLTPLGKLLVRLPHHPYFGKALIFSTIFQCLDPVLTATTVISTATDLFVNTMQDTSHVRGAKSAFNSTSDHLALAWMYAEWKVLREMNKRSQVDEFCNRSKLHIGRLHLLRQTCGLYMETLWNLGLMNGYPGSKSFMFESDAETEKNKYAPYDELVRAVILSASDQLLIRREFDFRKGRLTKSRGSLVTRNGGRASIMPESVNYGRRRWPSPFLTYFMLLHSKQKRSNMAVDTSMVSPLSVLLFSQGSVWCSEVNTTSNYSDRQKVECTLEDKKYVKIYCEKRTAKLLLRFRDVMWSVVNYFLKVDTDSSTEQQREIVEQYKGRMLETLVKMLENSATDIDNCKLNGNNPRVENLAEK